MTHAHISLVTLGVTDVPRAARFYEAMGFDRKMRDAPEHEVAFFDAGPVALSLYVVSGLARDAGFAPDSETCRPFAARRSPGIAKAKPRSMRSWRAR